MLHIKRFIDRVSMIENKQQKDLVLPVTEARGLRDEISKLLADKYLEGSQRTIEEPVIKLDIKGGSFK